jgi:hypothetical protein
MAGGIHHHNGRLHAQTLGCGFTLLQTLFDTCEG